MALNVGSTKSGGAQAQAAQQKLVPFRYGTRQRYRPVTNVALALGTSVSPPIEFKQVGFLNSIDLIMKSASAVGLTTGATAPTLSGKARWPSSLWQRVQVALNTGSAAILDLPGTQLEFVNWLIQRAYNPALSTDSDIYAATYNNTSTTNAINYRLRLPIAANDARDFTVGMLMLQSQQVILQVNVLWNTMANIFSANAPTITSTAPTMDVSGNIYAAPNTQRVQLPAPSLHRIMETSYPLTNTGDNIIRLPREGKLLRLYIQVVANGKFDTANSVDFIKIRLNDVSEPYNYTRQQLKALAMERYGQTLPAGWFVLDFWYADHHPAGGDQRDVIDTSAFSTTELIVNIDSGATLATGDYISVAREFIQFPRRTA